jgi:TatD DNase family protein
MTAPNGYINFHTHHPAKEGHFSLYNYIVKDGAEAIPQQPFSAGIHPWYIDQPEEQEKLLKKISANENCIAIGEAGIDHDCKTPLLRQEKAFTDQCALALELKKPMILHVVKSHFDVMKILQDSGIKKAVFHGYNNRYTILEKVLQNGFYVSIGAAIMNDHSPAAALIGQIPATQFFLETDDSHFSIEEIYAAAAEKRKTDIDDLQVQIAHNFKLLFS